MNRGIGVLSHLWAEGQASGRKLRGRYVVVDLDSGSVTRAELNEFGFADQEEAWTGAGVLDQLTRKLGSLLQADAASVCQLLLDGNAMAVCAEAVEDAINYNAPEEVCLTLGSNPICWEQLSAAMEELLGAVRPLSAQANVFLEGSEEDERLILYGTCAGFAPLQLIFRRSLHELSAEDFSSQATMPDPLFRYIADDGGISRSGQDLLNEHTVAYGPQTVPLRAALCVLDRHGNPREFVLSEQGQLPDQLPAGSPPVYVAENSPLRLDVNGSGRMIHLPDSFVGSGCAVTARALLEDGQLFVQFSDAVSPNKTFSYHISQEE